MDVKPARETGMKSSNLTLGAVLNSPNQYVIPVCQRHDRRDQPEWEKFRDDLAELRQPGCTGRHFMRSLALGDEVYRTYTRYGQDRRLPLRSMRAYSSRADRSIGRHQLQLL